MRRENNRYVLKLRVTARGQVRRTIESLSEDAAFADVEDHGIITSAGQKNLAMISWKRLPQRASLSALPNKVARPCQSAFLSSFSRRTLLSQFDGCVQA